MAFDLSTATPVNASSDESSSLLPGANEFPEIKQRAKKYKETEAERTAAVPTPNLAESAKLVPGVANDAISQAGNLGQGAFNYIKENPLAVPEAVLAYKGGQAVYKNLKEKFFGQSTPAKTETELFTKVDPDLNVSNKPVINEPMLDMAPAPATTQTTQTVDPVQAMKNKLLASSPESETDFIQRKFGPRYNPNPTEPAFFPVKPDVPPVVPETPPVTPEIPVEPALPPETKPPKPVKPKKADLANIANNPVEIPEQPGMRTQYEVPKTKGAIAINPATGEKYMGPGGYNWFASQVGHEDAPKRWEEAYGQKNVPHKQVQEDYAATRYPPTRETIGAKSGGSAGKPEFIPKYIKGAASPSALATTAVMTALPALGAAAYQKYKGNETSVDASIQDAKDSLKSLATMPYDVSKAALKGDFGPLKDLMLSMNPGSLLFNEMSKKDEEILKNMIQKEKVGAGRGIAPPSR